jgi:antirestriction protein ArdC
MPTQKSIRQQITNQIINALKNGNLPPWRRPWGTTENTGFPINVASSNRYRGVNPLLMQISANRHGLRSQYWGTFNQWKKLGGRIQRRPTDVPPGEWGTTITYFKKITKLEVDEDNQEEEIEFGFLRTYTVFNIDQVEGAHLDHLRAADAAINGDFVDYQPAEDAVVATEADIRFGGDRAYYVRPLDDGGGDHIQCPGKPSFLRENEYYATLLHELGHWSECRLNWQGNYAEGELRAEIAACYAMAELGVPQSEDLTNHQAYLQSWLKQLQKDPSFIFRSSSAASKAVDFLLSFSRTPEETPVST